MKISPQIISPLLTALSLYLVVGAAVKHQISAPALVILSITAGINSLIYFRSFTSDSHEKVRAVFVICFVFVGLFAMTLMANPIIQVIQEVF